MSWLSLLVKRLILTLTTLVYLLALWPLLFESRPWMAGAGLLWIAAWLWFLVASERSQQPLMRGLMSLGALSILIPMLLLADEADEKAFDAAVTLLLPVTLALLLWRRLGLWAALLLPLALALLTFFYYGYIGLVLMLLGLVVLFGSNRRSLRALFPPPLGREP